MVDQKRRSTSDSCSPKKRQAISFETKVAIIRKIDAGEKHANVARFFLMSPSTVNTIYKQKDCILEHVKSINLIYFVAKTKWVYTVSNIILL